MTPAPGRVQRPAAVAFAVLLLATAAAFGLANQLKSAPAEIDVISRDKFFSPNGDGRGEREVIRFRVDLTDSAAIDIIDADGVRVRRVAEDVQLKRDRKRKVVWDGRDDDGAVAPDGEYRMRLILGQGRSLLAPRPFFVDTQPPEASVELAEDQAPIVTPGTRVAFALRTEPGAEVAPKFRVLRTDVSPPREVDTILGEVGVTDYAWDGQTALGTAAPPGVYLIQATAFDQALNRARTPGLPLSRAAVPGRPGVTVRELALQPPVRAVRAGAPVSVRVDARGRAFSWALRRIGQPEVLLRGERDAGRTNVVLDLPGGSSGLYMLTVEAQGATARVPIAVRGGARTGLMVVLPMLTWLGRDPVDLTRDGVPDTFATAASVGFPRPFAFATGVPPYFGAGVAPLLEFLDAAEIDYDLVTDLDLAVAENALEGQDGVLFAAAAQWTTRALAGRLRDYARAGGRVALFGPQALTGTVEVADQQLTDASPLTDGDAFGGRLAPSRAVATNAPLSVLAEDEQLGLLEGFSGTLTGFGRVEALAAPGPGELRAGIGAEGPDLQPALSAVALGEGVVIRVGLPEWGERLAAGWAAPRQITANIVDILRGVQPRVRTARG